MDSNFDLGDAIERLGDDHLELDHERDINNDDPETILEGAVEAVADQSDAITIPEVFASYCSLLKHADSIPSSVMTKLLDSLSSGIFAEFEATQTDAANDSRETFETHKKALEMYAFVLMWAVKAADKVKGSDGGDNISALVAPRSRRGRGGKAGGRGAAAKKQRGSEEWNWTGQIPQILSVIGKVLARLFTQRLWTTTAEREKYIGCLTRPAYHVAENEQYMKSEGVRKGVYTVICLAVKHQGHAAAAQILIMQRLQYYEHLAEPMAQCLFELSKVYDHNQLPDEILREVAGLSFAGQDSKQTKSFSRFLTKFAQISPRTVLKQMSLLVNHLDAEAYNIRVAMIEVIGWLIKDLDDSLDGGATEEDTMDQKQIQKQIKGLFDMLFERMLDTSPYVRIKVLQVLASLCKLKRKHPKQRLEATRRAITALEDKSALARKAAIILLIELMETHPYGFAQGGLLNLQQFETEHEQAEAELKEVEARVGKALENADDSQEQEGGSGEVPEEKHRSGDDDDDDDNDDMDVDGEDVPTDEEKEEDPPTDDEDEGEQDGDDSMAVDGEEPTSPKPKKAKKKPKLKPRKSQINVVAMDAEAAIAALEGSKATQLRLKKKFFVEALKFIRYLEGSIDTLVALLGSTSKGEVLEAIRFFEVAHRYELTRAEEGIKKMLHLIWAKDNNVTEDDGKEHKGVKSRLLECYRNIYFDAVTGFDAQGQVNRIAKNMIERTYNATLAELTSLEEMIRILMEDGHIHQDVINKLWQIFEKNRQLPKEQRRGAIVIIGMMALAKRSVLADRVDCLLKVGLGALGKADLHLARYTCVALQRLNGSAKKVKGSLHDKTLRLPMDHAVFRKLQEFIERPCRIKDWFGVAEQAINTIYALGQHPDVLCNDIIKNLTRRAFGPRQTATATQEPPPDTDPDAMDEDQPGDTSRTSDTPPSQAAPADGMGDAFELSQLLFVVGHVAIKHIAYLELVEREMKRQKDEKQAAEKAARGGASATNKDGEELDQVAGNAEDDIGDRVHEIREQELLYGEQSLLAIFGPMLVHISGSPHKFKNPTLRAASTLSLCKFLCVSPAFCEENHRLLFKILENSKNASIRSNIVIGLGDVAVSFSSIIDENSSELYKGLSDRDNTVKKNTLMVLTHLILNGMVKVKGQLGEMAKCLEDEDQRIADLAKLFFTELSTKDNAIYNNLPDVISHLSTGEHALEEEKFKSTMKYIFTFIEKDKQADNIVEKLCQRFRVTDDERQWRDIAFCLSLLPYKSEKSVKKLIEALPAYQDKLHVDGVSETFSEILTKAKSQKSGNSKENVMAELQEFEEALAAHKLEGDENKALEKRVGKKKKAQAKKQATRRNVTRKSASTSTKPEDMDEDE
ncbi:condensin complex non-SMC subunit Cnd1 [Marasmius crinis-equi]|uniref:Condensin complex subunit 1 n=1 Tax=Marasmius crinis-equi TaxID=585013 RepID=A0ABR3FSE0_9AGAR